MEKQTRRAMLKGAAKAAVVAGGAVAMTEGAGAQVSGKLEKKAPLAKPQQPGGPEPRVAVVAMPAAQPTEERRGPVPMFGRRPSFKAEQGVPPSPDNVLKEVVFT